MHHTKYLPIKYKCDLMLKILSCHSVPIVIFIIDPFLNVCVTIAKLIIIHFYLLFLFYYIKFKIIMQERKKRKVK